MEEVDYQQSMTLNAHWEGFFDRESGVLFYQYGYDTKPLNASAFSLEPSGNVSNYTHLNEVQGVYRNHCLSICLSVCKSVYLSLRLSVCLSVCLYRFVYGRGIFIEFYTQFLSSLH